MLSIVRLSGLFSIWDCVLLPSPPAIVDALIDATSKAWACPRGAITRQIATATASPAFKNRRAAGSILMERLPQAAFRVGSIVITHGLAPLPPLVFSRKPGLIYHQNINQSFCRLQRQTELFL